MHWAQMGDRQRTPELGIKLGSACSPRGYRRRHAESFSLISKIVRAQLSTFSNVFQIFRNVNKYKKFNEVTLHKVTIQNQQHFSQWHTNYPKISLSVQTCLDKEE